MQEFLKYLVSFILAMIMLILIVLPVIIFGLWSLTIIPVIFVTAFIKKGIFDE